MKPRNAIVVLSACSAFALFLFVLGKPNSAECSPPIRKLIRTNQLRPSPLSVIKLQKVVARFYDDDSVSFATTTVLPLGAEIAYDLDIDLGDMRYTATANMANDDEPPEQPMTTCPYKYRVISVERRADNLQPVAKLVDVLEYKNGPFGNDSYPEYCWQKTRCWSDLVGGWNGTRSCPTNRWVQSPEGKRLLHDIAMSWRTNSWKGNNTVNIGITQENTAHPYGIFVGTDSWSRYPTRFSDDFRHSFRTETYR